MTGRKDFLVDWALVTIFYFASWSETRQGGALEYHGTHGGWDGLRSTWYYTVYSNE